MEITTGITEAGMVAIEVKEDEDDREPTMIVMPADIARQVAFSLMEEADKLDPPAWSDQ